MTYIDSSTFGVSNVSAPRHWLQVGGSTIPLLKSTVTRKSTRNADTFTADLALGPSAQNGISLGQWVDWDQSQDVSILYATQADGSDQQVMITGKLDKPSIMFDMMTVSVRSRDKSSALTEKRRSQKFANQTSSDIVTEIAQDNGLNPVVVGTSDFAGKKLTQDVAHLIQNRTDYEVVSMLAAREGFRWYVLGSDLHFEPKDEGTGVYPITFYPPGTAAPYAVGNCFKLTFDKNTGAARPHKVTVRSFHHQDQKLYQATASAGGAGDPIEYVHHHNGKTQAQVTALAKARLKDRIRHELSITAEVPGDLSADPHMQLSLTGTGTSLDQQFDIDTIAFKMGWSDHFTMTITAKAAKQGRTVDE